MAFPQRLLGDEEEVVLHLRTHAKALAVPVLVLLLVAAAAGFGWGFLPDDGAGPVLRLVVLGLAVLVVLRFALWPLLRWLTTTYTVTTERLITRTGVLNRTGRDIPLSRINDVAYEQSIGDRVVGAGTLVVSAASEQGQVVLDDVPRVHQVQLRLSELVRSAHGAQRYDLDGTGGDAGPR
ncbi:MAG TPA: PH domain-containing protein [Jiangellales bacterium]|nr:PH domain-containing protein [Jiangellales bacterium]